MSDTSIRELYQQFREHDDNDEKEFRQINSMLVKHDVQLTDISRDINELKPPKPSIMDKLTVVGLALGLIASIITGIWVLHESITSRPTLQQVDEIVKAHADQPIQDIKNEQSEQKNILNRMDDTIQRMYRENHR